jgi:CPA2 family monovalent cation:H+ antiporter-2
MKIAAPEGKEMIFPYDRVFVIGTDEQISAFQKFIEPKENNEDTAIDDFSYSLESHRVDSTSPLVGRSLREAGIREKCQGLVVGIEREGRRVLNPHSDTMIETGDILWIVGETGALKKMNVSAR